VVIDEVCGEAVTIEEFSNVNNCENHYRMR